MRGSFKLYMIAAGIILGVTGCGMKKADSGTPKPEIVLTVSMPSSEWSSYSGELTALYLKNHPEISKIEWNLVDRSMYTDLLRVSLASQKLPDIIYVGFDSSMAEWKDHLLPLDDMEALKQIPLCYREMGKLNEVTYSIPLQIEGIGIVYNMRLLEKAGYDQVPKTRTEFINLCLKLEEADIKPMINHYKETLLTMASNLFMLPAMAEEDPAAYMDSLMLEERQKEYEESWKALADFFDQTLKYGNRDSLTTGASTARNYFFIQKYAMLNDEGSWLTPVIRRYKPELEEKLSIGCIPLYEEASKNKLPIEVQALSVTKSSEYKEEAKEFLNWLVASDEAIKFMQSTMGCLPVVNMSTNSLQGLSPLSAKVKQMILHGDTALDVVNRLPEELRNKSAELWGWYLIGDLNQKEVLQEYQSLWKDFRNKN